MLVDWVVNWAVDWVVGWVVNWAVDRVVGWVVYWAVDWVTGGVVNLFDGLIGWVVNGVIDGVTDGVISIFIFSWVFGVGEIDPIATNFARSLLSSPSINSGTIGVDGMIGVFIKYAGCRSEGGACCHAFLLTIKAIAFLFTGHLGHSGAAWPFLAKNDVAQKGHFFFTQEPKLPSHLCPLDRHPIHRPTMVPGGTCV